VLEAESAEVKAAWTNALRFHIQYANPAKRDIGVDYNVLVRVPTSLLAFNLHRMVHGRRLKSSLCRPTTTTSRWA
jgi:hypothetical protein